MKYNPKGVQQYKKYIYIIQAKRDQNTSHLYSHVFTIELKDEGGAKRRAKRDYHIIIFGNQTKGTTYGRLVLVFKWS